MERNLHKYGAAIPQILLPETDDGKWGCIACDQYTSQTEVWQEIDETVGASPSTLRLVLPECYLHESDGSIPIIHNKMKEYLRTVLTRRIDGFILTARQTQSGIRKGLMLCVDLEQYDYSADSVSRIRATEGTILSRIPPRRKVREGADLEIPHVMLLINDRDKTLIEPLYAKYAAKEPLYNVDLIRDFGHLTGWEIAKEDFTSIESAIVKLDEARKNAPLFAVGDGNHSLASAKSAWEMKKATLPECEWENHPLRYALCEVVNLYDDALLFAPIHRVLTNVNADELKNVLENAAGSGKGDAVFVTESEGSTLSGLPIEVLQPALDEYLKAHPDTAIDYVHGDEAAATLGRKAGSCALLLPTPDKSRFFEAIAKGPLPRKAFSMGQANEKRCYYECRRITF